MTNTTAQSQHGEAVRDSVVRGLVNHCISHRDMRVRGVIRLRRDTIVLKQFAGDDDLLRSQKRGMINQFSHQSRYRLLTMAKNCNVNFCSMLTITYPANFPRDGRLVKRDLDCFKKWLRREVEGIAGLWFLEFQKRGAPHFHFLLSLDLADQGEVIVKRRSRRHGHALDNYQTCKVVEERAAAAWYRIVNSGDPKHLRAGVSWEILEDSDAAAKYAAKHAAKPNQKHVPDEYVSVGRFWGKLGDVYLIDRDGNRLDHGALETMTTEDIFRIFGADAMSNNGRVKKYLWDADKKEDDR